MDHHQLLFLGLRHRIPKNFFSTKEGGSGSPIGRENRTRLVPEWPPRGQLPYVSIVITEDPEVLSVDGGESSIHTDEMLRVQ